MEKGDRKISDRHKVDDSPVMDNQTVLLWVPALANDRDTDKDKKNTNSTVTKVKKKT